jgi:uncharacterized protein YndB with AHSA1/START domain
MKVVKWIGITIAMLAVVFFVVGFLLPSKYNVSRSTQINAPAEKVYALLASPRDWPKWTVWNRRDPAMKVTYSGAESGQGAKWAWESKSEGEGNMEFTRAEPGKRIEYVLVFPEFGMRSTGALTLLPRGRARTSPGPPWATSARTRSTTTSPPSWTAWSAPISKAASRTSRRSPRSREGGSRCRVFCLSVVRGADGAARIRAAAPKAPSTSTSASRASRSGSTTTRARSSRPAPPSSSFA